MSNFKFLKNIDEDLFAIINEAEKLYLDEYFAQSIIQTRRFAENLCKDLLNETAIAEGTFDEMISYFADRAEGHQVQKEFIEDLYFLKKNGNQSAHGKKVKNDAVIALECLQRSFEIAINYAIMRGISAQKVKSLHYDIDLLMTGKPNKKTLSEKYIEKQNQEINDYKKINKKNKTRKKQLQPVSEGSFQIGFVTILFISLAVLTSFIVFAFVFLK